MLSLPAFPKLCSVEIIPRTVKTNAIKNMFYEQIFETGHISHLSESHNCTLKY